MEEHFNFFPLLLVLLLAFAVPLILGRIRWLPIVIGEILAGILIGVSGLNLINENATLEVFSNIGLAFLMFLAGLEIDFDRLFPQRIKKAAAANLESDQDKGQPNLLAYAALVYLLTILLAIPGGFSVNALGLDGNPWLLAFVLSATSLGVLMPVLKSRGISHTISGQAIFYAALVADFATVILLTLFLIIHESGLNVEIFAVGLLFLAFFISYRILVSFFRLQPIQKIIEELSQVTVQIKVRGAFAVLMSFVALATLLGVELILGAFLAGMIISLIKTPDDQDLIHKLDAFGYGFFIPIFFIMVGVQLDLSAITESSNSLILLPLLLVISLIVKSVSSLVYLRIMPLRDVLGGGFILNTHLSLEIAVAVIGLRLGLLSPATSTALILFSVITILVMPVLANTFLPKPVPKEDQWILIYSANDLGLQVAKKLKQHGEQVQFLETSARLAKIAEEEGYDVTFANDFIECLEQIPRTKVLTLLALSVHDERNIQICKAANCAGIDQIISIVNDPSNLPIYQQLEVKPFNPELYQPALLAIMARSPNILSLMTSTQDDQDLREVRLGNPELDGRRVRTLGLPVSLLVLAVNRNGEMIVPHGNTRLQLNDMLTLYGNIDELKDTINLLSA